MKKWIALILGIWLAFCCCGCEEIQIPVPPVLEPEKEIVIGVISDMTDKRSSTSEPSPDGISFYYGVQYAVNEAVEAYRGKLTVTMLEGDIEGDLAKAKTIFSAMFKKGVDAIVCRKDIAAKIASSAEKNNVVLMVPDYDEQGVDYPKEDDEDQTPDSMVRKRANVFSLLPDGTEYGKIAALFAKLQGYDSAVVVYDKNDVFWTEAAESFEKAFTGYGKKVTESKAVVFDNSELTKDTLEKVCGRNKADCLFIGAPFDRVVLAGIPGAHSGGYYGKSFFYGAASDYTAAFDGEDASYGLFNEEGCLSVFSTIPKRTNQAFYDGYQTYYGETASFAAALGYDGASVVLAAAAKAGDGSFDRLMIGMRGLRYSGATGSLYYADNSGFPLRSLFGMIFRFSYEDSSYTIRVKYPALSLAEDALEEPEESSEPAEPSAPAELTSQTSSAGANEE